MAPKYSLPVIVLMLVKNAQAQSGDCVRSRARLFTSSSHQELLFSFKGTALLQKAFKAKASQSGQA